MTTHAHHAAPDDPGIQSQYVYVREQMPGSQHGRSLDRVVQALLPVGIAALIGVVWMLSLNNVKLAATVDNQGNEISELALAVKELSSEVRYLREARYSNEDDKKGG